MVCVESMCLNIEAITWSFRFKFNSLWMTFEHEANTHLLSIYIHISRFCYFRLYCSAHSLKLGLLFHSWNDEYIYLCACIYIYVDVILPPSVCLVDRLTIEKWCRRAGSGRLKRCAYPRLNLTLPRFSYCLESSIKLIMTCQ